MSKKSLILKLAKSIAPNDAKIWIDDMISELGFVKNNKFAWQIGALNFAIKQRFANINLFSPQSIAVGSFALSAILAVIFVLPYKNILFPQNSNQQAITTEAEPVALPQAAAAPSRNELSAELRTRVNEVVDDDGEKNTETDTQTLSTAANSPISGTASPTPAIPVDSKQKVTTVSGGSATAAAGATGPAGSAATSGSVSTAPSPTIPLPANPNDGMPISESSDLPSDTIAGNTAAAPEMAAIVAQDDDKKVHAEIIKESSILVSFIADAQIKIYSGTTATAEHLILDKLAKKNEELVFELPVYLEVDDAASILINNLKISNAIGEFIAVFKSSKNDN